MSPCLVTDCLWFLCTALGVVRGTQQFPNYTRWMLLSHWRVTSVLGLGVTGACDVVSVTDEFIALCEVTTVLLSLNHVYGSKFHPYLYDS
jgi:hypothetical protein